MLKRANQLQEYDPYIMDSLGWAFYLTGNYNDAEKYIRSALELMPLDPIISDHYADILWQLNRKIQARYFWKNILKLEEIEEEFKIKIKKKIIFGKI